MQSQWHTRLLQSRAALLASLAFVLSITTSAAASDSKYFNGAFCRVSFDFGGASLGSSADYSTNGSVANTNSTTAMNLTCPIVRDNVANTVGWDSVEIGYFDKSALDAIQCTAFSSSFADGSTFWQETKFSANNGAAVWSKTNMTFNDPATDSLAGGFDYIRCIVPQVDPASGAASGIAYYRVQEP